MPSAGAYVLEHLAEHAYERASAHWQACAVCTAAGGEIADDALCPLGRLLAAQWAAAEARTEPSAGASALDALERARQAQQEHDRRIDVQLGLGLSGG